MSLLGPLAYAAALLAAPAEPRFAEEIGVFAVEDESNPPPRCATLFVGSSSIRFWFGLREDFAFPTIRRGFGGATIADVNDRFERVVAPYRPARIVFYAGENDLAAGRPAEAAFADFEAFLARKDAALGATPVWFVSAKPSPARWAQVADQRAFNARVAALAKQRRDLAYVDVAGPMLAAGQPRPELYISDGLHMKRAGYAIWAKAIGQALKSARLARAPGC